jgi:hypothetical protein
MPVAYAWTREVYEKLGAADRIRVIRNIRDWQPASLSPAHVSTP